MILLPLVLLIVVQAWIYSRRDDWKMRPVSGFTADGREVRVVLWRDGRYKLGTAPKGEMDERWLVAARGCRSRWVEDFEDGRIEMAPAIPLRLEVSGLPAPRSSKDSLFLWIQQLDGDTRPVGLTVPVDYFDVTIVAERETSARNRPVAPLGSIWVRGNGEIVVPIPAAGRYRVTATLACGTPCPGTDDLWRDPPEYPNAGQRKWSTSSLPSVEFSVRDDGEPASFRLDLAGAHWEQCGR